MTISMTMMTTTTTTMPLRRTVGYCGRLEEGAVGMVGVLVCVDTTRCLVDYYGRMEEGAVGVDASVDVDVSVDED